MNDQIPNFSEEIDAAELRLRQIAGILRGASALLEIHAARAAEPICDVDILIDAALEIADPKNPRP